MSDEPDACDPADLEGHLRFLDGPPVATMRGDEVPVFERLRELASWAGNHFETQFGGTASHPSIGQVMIDERSAMKSIGHGMGRLKAQAFYLLPHVIERGRLIFRRRRGSLDGLLIGAPIQIGQIDLVCVALVRKDANLQRLYLHEAIQKEKLRAPINSRAPAVAGELTASATGVMRSILHEIFSVNEGDNPL